MSAAMMIIIPLALLLAATFVFGFLKSVSSGQMDDLETPAFRILKDETERKENI